MPKEKLTARMIVPDYVHQFKCIGPECPDHCCWKWEVQADQQDYDTLRHHPAIAELSQQALKLLPAEQQTKAKYATITLKEDRTCAYLDEHRWCKIHAQLGEDELPDICHEYPRTVLEVDGVWRQSSTLSCPEMARLCLHDPDAMHMEVREVAARPGLVIHRTSGPVLGAYGQDLHDFFIGLIQARDYPFWQRLALIALVCHEADGLIAAQRQHELPAVIADLKQAVLSGECRTWLDPVQPDLRERMATFGKMLTFGLNRDLAVYFDKVFSAFASGYKLTDTFDPDYMALRYQAIWAVCMKPFFEQHPHSLENLFLHQLFSSVFPIGLEQGLLANCCSLLIARYNMLMLLLTGMAVSLGPAFNLEYAMWAVQVLAKNYDHNQSLGKLGRELAQNENPIPVILTLLAEPDVAV